MQFCSEDSCTHVILNADSTRTCSLYGICFGQKLCDIGNTNGISTGGGGHSAGTMNGLEYTFDNTLKRDQEIENMKLDESLIISWASELIAGIPLTIVHVLSKQIKKLWDELISVSRKTGHTIRRKDKRCVTVAIIASLCAGLSARSGTIVSTHNHTFHKVMFNKRSSKIYGNIGISDIRSGQRILKQVFQHEKCMNPINVLSNI